MFLILYNRELDDPQLPSIKTVSIGGSAVGVFTKETLRRNCENYYKSSLNPTSPVAGVFTLEFKHQILFCQIRKGGSQYWESLVKILDESHGIRSSYNMRDTFEKVRDRWRKVSYQSLFSCHQFRIK